MNKRKIKGILTWILIFVMLMQTTAYAEGWKQENSNWYYEQNGTNQTGWINDGTGRYHFDENGKLQTGWYQENQIWYFLNTVHDGFYGRALNNQWAWIDGYSYSFDADGKMYANCITPDGYEVNADGKWTVNGVVQFIEGKGIITTATTPGSGKVSGGITRGGGGSGGGGGGGGSHNSGGGSSTIPDESKDDVPEAEGIEFVEGVKAATLDFVVNETDEVIIVPDVISDWRAGDIVFFKNKTSPEKDIIIKVTAIENAVDSTKVYYDIPALEEVVESIDISGVEKNEGTFIPAEGVEVTPISRSRMRSTVSETINVFQEMSISLNMDGVVFSGAFRLNSITYQYATDNTSEGLNINNGKFIIDSALTGSCALTRETTLKKIKIGSFIVPLVEPWVATGDINLVVDAQGRFGIDVTLAGETGVQFTKNNGMQPICNAQPSLGKATLTGSVQFKVSIPIDIRLGIIKIFEVGGEVGIELKGDIKIINEIPFQMCFDGKLFKFAYLYAQFGEEKFNIRGEFSVWNSSKPDCIIMPLHIEETGIVPRCTREEDIALQGIYQGEVTDTVTHSPINNAKIEVRDDGTIIKTIYTDEYGFYKGKLSEGIYKLNVSAADYITKEVPIDIEAGKTTESAINLLPVNAKGDYEGYVKDFATFNPVQNAVIKMTNEDGITVDTVYSDENGYYKGNKLSPGNYILYAVAEGYNSYEMEIGIYVDKTAKTIINLDAKKSKFVGNVLNTDGEEIEQAKVEVILEGTVIDTVYTDNNGLYETAFVASGNYTIQVSAEGFKTQILQLTIQEYEVKTLSISMEAEEGSGSYCGYVHQINGWDNVTDDVNVQKFVPIPEAKVELLSMEDGTVISTVYTNAHGYFEGTCPIGTYDVRVSHEGYPTDNSDSAGYSPGITITKDKKLELDFDLEALKVSVYVQVLGDTGECILSVRNSNGQVLKKSMMQNIYGYYDFRIDLLPGEYTLTVTLNGYSKSEKVICHPNSSFSGWTINMSDHDPSILTAINDIPITSHDDEPDNNKEPASPSDADRVASPSNAQHEEKSTDTNNNQQDKTAVNFDEAEHQTDEAVVDETEIIDIDENENTLEFSDKEEALVLDNEDTDKKDDNIGDEDGQKGSLASA